MSIPKIVGIEQEYAIKVANAADLSVFHASCALVDAYARKTGLREPKTRMVWDYGHETPFQDIRGRLFKKATGQEIMSAEDNRRINVSLANGARLYTDHAHPEYSTPECVSALDAVAADKAGELVLRQAMEIVHKNLYPTRISLFKNNTDQQGHSYGCHENYLVDADAHQRFIAGDGRKAVSVLAPFLVTRIVFAGAGKVGHENGNPLKPQYQLSQRADFMENVFGLETTYARPLINTREEHHADDKRFRRLHLIVGDANMCEFASFLKIGSAQLVLAMLEDDFIGDDFALKNPVKAMKIASADFNAPLELENGRSMNAVEMQREFLNRAVEFCEKMDEKTVPDAGKILECWEEALDGVEEMELSEDLDIEDDPFDMVQKLDWALKLWVVNRARTGGKMKWDDPRIKVLDLKYHNIDETDGIFYHLQKQGVAERLLADADIERRMHNPPDDTRAFFRGKCIEKFPEEINIVNWEVVGFDQGDVYRMIPLPNPLKGTRERFESIFENCRNAADLIAAVAR